MDVEYRENAPLAGRKRNTQGRTGPRIRECPACREEALGGGGVGRPAGELAHLFRVFAKAADRFAGGCRQGARPRLSQNVIKHITTHDRAGAKDPMEKEQHIAQDQPAAQHRGNQKDGRPRIGTPSPGRVAAQRIEERA